MSNHEQNEIKVRPIVNCLYLLLLIKMFRCVCAFKWFYEIITITNEHYHTYNVECLDEKSVCNKKQLHLH